MASLFLWQNGALVGEWQHSPHNADRFRYASSWIESPAARTLSASFPWSSSAREWITGPVVGSWFENLLPDSPLVRDQIARRFGVRPTAFELLNEIGRDCVGAVQLLTDGEQPSDVRSIQCQALTEQQVAEEIQRASHPSTNLPDSESPFRISLAGAQEKTALLLHRNQWCRPIGSTPTTHILKLPLNQVGDVPMPHSLENEWFCGKLLSECELPVAQSEILHFGEWSCLAVQRFDRRLAPDQKWWMRLPQEDLCQAFGIPSRNKYENDGGPGISNCVEFLRGGSTNPLDAINFLRAQVLFWILQAPDGHGKNFSIQHQAGGGFRLTPIYDVLSAYPISGHGRNRLPAQQIKMAMAVTGKNRHYRWKDIQPRHWLEHGLSMGMQTELENLLHAIPDQVDQALANVQPNLPSTFPSEVLGPIVEGVEKAASRLRKG
jgi:serine/threonine-protein kinase HipA